MISKREEVSYSNGPKINMTGGTRESDEAAS